MDVQHTALACLLGGFFLIALVRLLRKPLRLAVRLAVNTALVFAARWLVGATAGLTGITLGVNLFNAALIGALVLPGFLLLLLSQWVLG